jgi:hypothetical protein
LLILPLTDQIPDIAVVGLMMAGVFSIGLQSVKADQ